MTRWRWLLGALLVLHVGAAVHVAATTDWDTVAFTSGDTARYREIAHTGGVPYRDVEVEFPPVSWAAVRLIGAGPSPTTSGRLLVATQLLCDVVVAGALAWAWSRRAAGAWLALLLPLLWDGWIFARIDLLSVALAVAGLALARRGVARAGGAVVGVAVMAKLWPLAVAPGLVVERHRRAAWWAAGVTAVGAALWWAVGGAAGLRQVTTFRGATGWQVESTFGSVLHLAGVEPLRGEAGAVRIGAEPGWARPVLAIAIACSVAGIWWLARRASERSDDGGATEAAGLASVAAVSVVLVLAPIISPQYVVWLLPFAAIAVADRAIAVATATMVVLTALVAHHYSDFLEGHRPWTIALVARNALLVVIAVGAVARLAQAAARHRVEPSVMAAPG